MIRFRIPYPKNKREWSEYGLNKYYAGKHWAKRKEDAIYWHWLVRSYAPATLVMRGEVQLTFRWNDKLDLSNHAVMAKMIEDSLKGYIIQDDNRRYVKRIVHEWHDSDYIEVIIDAI